VETPDAGNSLYRAIAADGAVRIMVVDVRQAAEETRLRHGLGPGAARIGADAVVAAALMSGHVKGDERMTLQIQGTVPRLGLFAEVDAEGSVRARVTPPDLKARDGGRITGVLAAIKSSSEGEMYRGATQIEDGNLEAALTEHLTASAQVDAVLRIGSVLGEDGSVRRALGALVEKLPARDGDLASDLRAMAVLEVARDQSAEELVEAVVRGALLGEPIAVLEQRLVLWRCRCSKERVERTLVSLGQQTLLEMAEEDDGAEVCCHFCNEAYRLDADALRRLAEVAEPEA